MVTRSVRSKVFSVSGKGDTKEGKTRFLSLFGNGRSVKVLGQWSECLHYIRAY